LKVDLTEAYERKHHPIDLPDPVEAIKFRMDQAGLSIKDLKAELLANPAVRQAYDEQAPENELARELIAARMQAGLTQGDVAARMGTTQSVVARIESGRGTPSMRTVQRFASAVGDSLNLDRCALSHCAFRLACSGALSFDV
jgi:antitoxin component HigA of HigAB toxin-antitoxin module